MKLDELEKEIESFTAITGDLGKQNEKANEFIEGVNKVKKDMADFLNSRNT